ncbi:M20/M25/M40 family metallo-hydrolase [Salinilacihabitans rarus]|uniref:M20/M25/M40 family metallo-hydrolase n=1 Tax=Salinilacihabitans rarus TaxID=2961596 RepID=UPI0020C83CF9|nr:M20/M25/M40 family metallo-hydrolase [Salinilacihabitans rarus]
MDDSTRAFLTDLLETPSPAGFEAAGQRRWTEYVAAFADEVRTDAYGNAVAVREGDPDAPAVALAGHADEIGLIVRSIDDDGFVRPGGIGGIDPTVARGQRVTIHADDGPVEGVVGRTAIHLREGDDDAPEVADLWIDVGAADGEDARERVAVGDPITFSGGVSWLTETRLAGRGLDNRVGTWAAAEGLRRAAERDASATVYAVSTVQEEVGRQGAKMVGFDLDPDAVVAVDVGHALDYPTAPRGKASDVELGAGPAVGRGSTNHPVVCRAVREAAADAGIEVQVEALGTGTGTDADAFFTAAGAIPSQVISVPTRYMHTPVEVIDVGDLEATAELLAAFAAVADEHEPFAVDV